MRSGPTISSQRGFTELHKDSKSFLWSFDFFECAEYFCLLSFGEDFFVPCFYVCEVFGIAQRQWRSMTNVQPRS